MTLEAIFTTLFVKFKGYTVAVFAAFAASTVRVIQYKRNIREGKNTKPVPVMGLMDWFLFGVMAAAVSTTVVSIIEYLGFEFTTPMVALLFWVAWMTDYLFQWIPAALKSYIERYKNE